MPAERDRRGRFPRGLRVAVTRPIHQAKSLAQALSEAGAVVLYRPLIRIVPPADPSALHAAAGRTGSYDWIVFTSANAVDKFSEALRAGGGDPSQFPQTRIAAVGPATAAALEASGFHVDLLPGEEFAEAVAAALAGAHDLAGRRVLWPRAQGASNELMAALIRFGAIVDSVEAYHTLPDPIAGASLAREVAAGAVDVLTFTSPSAVRGFVGSGGYEVGPATIVVIGPVTAAEARARGLPVHVEATPHTVDGMVAALRTYYGARP